jgi:hypothetical protein
MRAAISEPLQAYLRQHGRTVLTITLKPIRGSGSTVFEVLVDPHAPKHPTATPRLRRMACVSTIPRNLIAGQSSWNWIVCGPSTARKPMMTGPEDLVASVLDLRTCERGREQTCGKRPRSAVLHWLLLTWDTSAYYNHHIRIYVYDH